MTNTSLTGGLLIPRRCVPLLLPNGPGPGDWPRDLNRTGSDVYEHICDGCRRLFYGSEKRRTCRTCATKCAQDANSQSKIESWLESFCNNGSAFLISLFWWAYVIQPLYDNKILTSALAITISFTIISLIRSYLWRRFFNARLHTTIHKWVQNAYRNNWKKR